MGTNWAITIGINHYDNLQDLQFAKRDAEEMRGFFLNDLQIDPKQIYHFSEDADPIPAFGGQFFKSQPAYAALRQFLRIRFEEPFLQAQDNLWFFFAGHGVQHKGQDYLMPLDGDPGDVEHTAIPLSYITERLRGCGAANVILFIDACRKDDSRSGIGVGNELQQGVITFYACSPSRRSYEIEHPDIAHGAFTYALLQGLRLQSTAQNCATVERLNHHLEQQVPKLNQQYGKPPQNPYSKIEPITKGHLILLPRLASIADVTQLKIDAYRAETQQRFYEAKQLWYRLLAVNGTDPEVIGAIERLARISVDSTPAPRSVSSTQASSREAVEAKPQAIDSPEIASQPIKVTPHPIAPVRKDFSENLGNGIELEMVHIPAGEFLMGSPESELERYEDEGPQHQVTVATFWMGKYPITQEQWELVTSWPQVNRELSPKPSRFEGGKRPVEQVSWWDAAEFCARLSQRFGKEYRLLSEAEWEYACRARTQTPFYFGETITTDQANYNGNYTYGNGPTGQYRQETTPVDSFPANEFGLCDMHGNVWEWCLDHWHEEYKNAPTDETAWLDKNENHYYVLRGGSWNLNPWLCRSASRSRIVPVLQYYVIGFRVVCVGARAF